MENKPIYATEFKNQFDSWQIFHAFRSKEHALKDAGSSGRVIECVEIAVVEQLKAELTDSRNDLSQAGYDALEYATEISVLKSKLKIAKTALEMASNYMDQHGQDATYYEAIISKIGGEM